MPRCSGIATRCISPVWRAYLDGMGDLGLDAVYPGP